MIYFRLIKDREIIFWSNLTFIKKVYIELIPASVRVSDHRAINPSHFSLESSQIKSSWQVLQYSQPSDNVSSLAFQPKLAQRCQSKRILAEKGWKVIVSYHCYKKVATISPGVEWASIDFTFQVIFHLQGWRQSQQPTFYYKMIHQFVWESFYILTDKKKFDILSWSVSRS